MLRRDWGPRLDLAVGEDVDAHTAAVYQRAQEPRARQLLQVAAGLGEPEPAAVDLADPEVATDERVDVDAAGEDVAPSAREVERRVAGGEVLHHLRRDKSQLVAGPVSGARAQRAGAARVAVPVQSAPGDGTGGVEDLHWRLGVRGDGDL